MKKSYAQERAWKLGDRVSTFDNARKGAIIGFGAGPEVTTIYVRWDDGITGYVHSLDVAKEAP